MQVDYGKSFGLISEEGAIEKHEIKSHLDSDSNSTKKALVRDDGAYIISKICCTEDLQKSVIDHIVPYFGNLSQSFIFLKHRFIVSKVQI